MGNIATSLENTLHQESRDLLFWIRHCFSGWKTKSRPWKRMFRHFSSLQTDLNSNPCLTPVISCEHWCSPCYSIFGGLHTVIIFFLTTGRCYLYPIIICLCFFFSQILEKQTLVTQTAEHRYSHVYPCFCHMWRDSLVWILALRVWSQHKGGPPVPLLRQERNQVHHQVARVPPAACRVPAALQDARWRTGQTDLVALCLRT